MTTAFAAFGFMGMAMASGDPAMVMATALAAGGMFFMCLGTVLRVRA